MSSGEMAVKPELASPLLAGEGVRIDAGSGPVLVEAGALDRLSALLDEAVRAHRYAIVTDATVRRLHGERLVRALKAGGLDADVIEIPPGEREKSRERWSWITDQLLDLGHARDSAILAFGGGVIGDLAGFTAATFMRGIPVVQLPTTLLAMVDASVGGKTAVDVPAGKNLVGAFHPPALVVADPDVLSTLPPRELRSGMAEVLKHGVIADAQYLAETVAALPALLGSGGGAGRAMVGVVARSMEIKAAVVREDAREHGRRRILNYGHTLGHALEQTSGYALPHGEAIAIGMHLEAALAERIGVAAPGTAAAVKDALVRAGLPTAAPVALAADPDRLLAFTARDKKVRAGQVEYSLPAAIGRMAGADRGWGVPVSDREVLALLRLQSERGG